MNESNKRKYPSGEKRNIPEKTLLEIFQIIYKNKLLLIISVGVCITLTLIYIFISNPVYESSITLKKENSPEDRKFGAPDISMMLSFQSTDVIETEMQLITTFPVMSKVVEQLNLYCTIESLTWNGNESAKINKTYLDMLDPEFRSKNLKRFIIPRKFEISSNDTSDNGITKYIIRKEDGGTYSLLDAADFKVLAISVIDSANIDIDSVYLSELKTSNITIKINWDDAPVKSELYISLNGIDKTVEHLIKNTKVAREGKTDIFYIKVSSNSATSSAVIANAIVDSYRDSRLAQKKELIRNSFDFVDKQLNEIQDKLKLSENELSGFKASGRIMSIDASSQELMGFLGKLETEKFSTELQLTDYRNRAAELETELKKRGYFDQNILNPQGLVEGGNSPFSKLMAQISDLELQRIELLQKRTENHPDVIAIDDQIKLAKDRLAEYNVNTISAFNIIINTLENKLLKINNLMSGYETKMKSLPSQENKLAQLIRRQSTYERIFTILLDQREALRVAELSKMQDITIVDGAKVPLNPSWPNKLFLILISLIIGSFFGILVIFSTELYRTRFVDLDKLETEFQVPLLSIIPEFSEEIIKSLNNPRTDYKLATMISNDNGLIETFRLLKTKLSQVVNPEHKILMITSCEEGTGKTSVAANLAVSLSQEKKRVLLVDCDLRKGNLSKVFGLNKINPGIIDYLTQDSDLKIYTRTLKLIDILPSGGITEDSGTILHSNRMKSLINHLSKSAYDIIIFDTPPVTRVVDTLVLARYIKDIIVVVRPNVSLVETVRWGMQELNNANVRIVGIVANAANIKNSYYYRYRYGYGYEYGNGKSKKIKLNKNQLISKIYS